MTYQYAFTYLMGIQWFLAELMFFPHDQSSQKLISFSYNGDQSRKIYNSFTTPYTFDVIYKPSS